MDRCERSSGSSQGKCLRLVGLIAGTILLLALSGRWLEVQARDASATPVVSEPNAATTWSRGYVANVRWVAEVDADTCFRLELVRDERSVWEITPCALNSFTGRPFRFVTPGNLPPANDYRVKVSLASDPTVMSLSEPFTITANPSAPHGRVERPGAGLAAGPVGAGDSEHGFTLETWVYWPNLACDTPDDWPSPPRASVLAPRLAISGALTVAAVFTPTVPEFPDPKHPGMHPRVPAYTCLQAAGADGAGGQQPGPTFCWVCELNQAVGDWHHVALVYDPAQPAWLLYVDGRHQSANPTMPAPAWPPGATLVVGGGTAANYEELRISASARYTEAVVEPPGVFACDAQTVALYHFDEPAGSPVVHDACGSGDTLTQQSGATTADWWPEGEQMQYLPAVRRGP